jgi:hypothetical protein
MVNILLHLNSFIEICKLSHDSLTHAFPVIWLKEEFVEEIISRNHKPFTFSANLCGRCLVFLTAHNVFFA